MLALRGKNRDDLLTALRVKTAGAAPVPPPASEHPAAAGVSPAHALLDVVMPAYTQLARSTPGP
jgi:hypothetical protein